MRTLGRTAEKPEEMVRAEVILICKIRERARPLRKTGVAEGARCPHLDTVPMSNELKGHHMLSLSCHPWGNVPCEFGTGPALFSKREQALFALKEA